MKVMSLYGKDKWESVTHGTSQQWGKNKLYICKIGII